MNQYSPKNQCFLTAEAALREMPQPTDVRPFKAWKAAGRSVKKGEKALHVWIPKRGKAAPTELAAVTGTASEETMREYFVRGPVFDISQTKEAAPRHRKSQNSALSEYREEQAWSEYEQAIAAGEIPADLDIADWYELKQDSIRVAAGCESNVGASEYGTIATQEGVIIAQYQHVNA